jgi:hypothetical protein
MADERAGLWFVTDVETSETVEVVEGGRSSDDVGGGFGSSAVQAVRKSLTQRVQISADELKRQIGNLLTVVGDVSISRGPRLGCCWMEWSCRSKSARKGRSASSAAAASSKARAA